jgi:hypothetical protein
MTKLVFLIRPGQNPAIYLSAVADPGFAIILEIIIYIPYLFQLSVFFILLPIKSKLEIFQNIGTHVSKRTF